MIILVRNELASELANDHDVLMSNCGSYRLHVINYYSIVTVTKSIYCKFVVIQCAYYILLVIR